MLTVLASIALASAGVVAVWRGGPWLARSTGALLVIAALGLTTWRPPARAALANERAEAARFCADVGFVIASWQRAFNQGLDEPPTRDAHRRQFDSLSEPFRTLGTACMVDYNACENRFGLMHLSDASPDADIAELVAAFETRTTCRRPARRRR